MNVHHVLRLSNDKPPFFFLSIQCDIKFYKVLLKAGSKYNCVGCTKVPHHAHMNGDYIMSEIPEPKEILSKVSDLFSNSGKEISNPMMFNYKILK